MKQGRKASGRVLKVRMRIPCFLAVSGDAAGQGGWQQESTVWPGCSPGAVGYFRWYYEHVSGISLQMQCVSYGGNGITKGEHMLERG